MIFGRKTAVVMAAITSSVGAIGVILIALHLADPGTVAAIGGAIVTIVGGWIAVLANTSLTPIDDARLESGTKVTVIDKEGTPVGQSTV